MHIRSSWIVCLNLINALCSAAKIIISGWFVVINELMLINSLCTYFYNSQIREKSFKMFYKCMLSFTFLLPVFSYKKRTICAMSIALWCWSFCLSLCLHEIIPITLFAFFNTNTHIYIYLYCHSVRHQFKRTSSTLNKLVVEFHQSHP